jgi:tetratricopeptide (TPR) repeat protein
LKPSRFPRACRRRLFSRSLLAVLLYLLQPGPPLIADEQDDGAKVLSLNKQVIELYQAGKFSEAIPIAQEFLELCEKAVGPNHPGTAYALNNLATLYYSMGDYAKAEPLAQRALQINEKALGPDHPGTAHALNNLAALYDHMGNYAKAEPLCQRALKIEEKALGPDHPDLALIHI